MLHQLEIENYAVIEKLRVSFHTGLHVLSGETGSGKSILVDAFSLLLGARASPDLVRTGAERARVAGVFELSLTPGLRAALDEAGLELEEGELLAEREILANGKSRAYLNGRLTTAATLRQLSPVLGDIHGQHEQQDLFSADTQRSMLDRFASAEPLVERAGVLFRSWSETVRRLEELRRSEQEKLRLLDLHQFQCREIAEAAPEPGEDARLEEEKRVLANLTRIQQAAGSAFDVLYESPASAVAQLKAAARSFEDLGRLDHRFTALAQSLDIARISVQEAALEVRHYLDRLEADPGRLAQLEDRLALLERLKRKYGGSLEEVLAFGRQAAAQLAELQSSEDTARHLEKERDRLKEEYQHVAAGLSSQRRQAAARLQKPVEKELAALAMQRTRFEVAVTPAPDDPGSWSAPGWDRVAFLVSPNPGEPLRPLESVASGGELSRITLALKTCLAAGGNTATPPRTLVFDEIDAGIGGRAADAVGRRLQCLARSNQLLCVTHLPQIAGFADHHYVVDKQVRAGRTLTAVTELAPDERVQELARMLSGAHITAEALEHARQLLQTAQGVRA